MALDCLPLSPAIRVLQLVDTLCGFPGPEPPRSSRDLISPAFPCGGRFGRKRKFSLGLEAASGSTFPDRFPWYGVLDSIEFTLFAFLRVPDRFTRTQLIPSSLIARYPRVGRTTIPRWDYPLRLGSL